MEPLWTSHDIAAATGGVASADFAVSSVTFDSREVDAGSLFIALKGEATDGHKYLDSAFVSGAAGALVSQGVTFPNVLVDDSMEALNALGVASRGRTAAKIAGVTGSVGKTGTKEALSAALARGNIGSVHRSVKSYNNHTGVPLSLARMPADSAFGVFEMGMNHAGELSVLTQIVRPHVALVTAIASAHREFFASEAAIADAKGEIFAGLEPGGTAIIPFDSVHRDRLIAAAKPHASHIITFGRGDGADVRAIDEAPTANGTMVTASLPGAELYFTISQPGDHWVSNALAIMAAVQALGGDLAAAGLALADFEGLAGRGARHQVAAPNGGTALIIDESYNANPASMRATLKVLAAADAVRRIVVLGEMRELGDESDALHADLAEPILAAGVGIALLIGERMVPLAKALEGRIECVHCASAETALDSLRGLLSGGDAILIKGSNAVGLSRLIGALSGGNN
jgi:UDP-N-acetylmuramoyl-tripeptide--D-alanyl-D-alanine ligase